MAEILLSLTIIGVVAAITLPSLTGNINERTWNTQRKALYARMSQAVSLMPSLNGYGTLTTETEDQSAVDNATETFLADGLSKVLKINNICDNEHLQDCGLPEKITNLNGTTTISLSTLTTMFGWNPDFIASGERYGLPTDIKAAAFETANGESILTYYNPNCSVDMQVSNQTTNSTQHWMCANFVYDLNGTKGPNTVGKDIGIITVLYATDSNVVEPYPLPNDLAQKYTQAQASNACTAQNSESRLPNRDELVALFYNNRLFNLGTNSEYWSSTLIDSTNGWVLNTDEGTPHSISREEEHDVRCIKRN